MIKLVGGLYDVVRDQLFGHADMIHISREENADYAKSLSSEAIRKSDLALRMYSLTNNNQLLNK